MNGPGEQALPPPPAGHRLLDTPPEAIAPATVGVGPRPEPLARLGNYAAAGVCVVAAYEVFFMVAALLVLASGSLGGVVLLNALYWLFFMVLVLAGVPFIAWFYRAYRNLPLLDFKPRFSGGMAIGCWLIPFANWALPGMIGDEIWKAGQPPDRPPRADSWNLARVWWGVYIGTGVVAVLLLVALGLLAGAGERTFALWTMLTSGMVIFSAGLAIAFVRRASERLDALCSYEPPGDGLDRAIGSIYGALPVSPGLTEEGASARRDGGAPPPHFRPTTAAVAHCTHCGAEEEAAANFCGSCGAPLR